MTTQTPDAVREAAILAQAREAAAQAFDARAKKAGHPATVTMERHHAKVIRQGEGDDYDAVQSALIALRLAALDSGADHDRSIYEQGRRDACEDHDIALDNRAGDGGEEERARQFVERLDGWRFYNRAEFDLALFKGAQLIKAMIGFSRSEAATTPAPAADASEDRHPGWTERGHAWLDAGAPVAPAVDAAPAGEADRTLAAGRIIDVMTGGKFDWRSRLEDSDFLESADWLTALAYADAALSRGDAA